PAHTRQGVARAGEGDLPDPPAQPSRRHGYQDLRGPDRVVPRRWPRGLRHERVPGPDRRRPPRRHRRVALSPSPPTAGPRPGPRPPPPPRGAGAGRPRPRPARPAASAAPGPPPRPRP